MQTAKLVLYDGGVQQYRLLTSPRPTASPGGYIVIIVLLLTAVLLMLGLSLASRTTEEVALSGQQADTTRVFNAAETGVEEALFQINSGAVTGLTSTPTDVVSDGSGSPAARGQDSKVLVTAKTADSFTVTVPEGEVLSLPWKENTTLKWAYADCAQAAAVVATLYTPYTPEQANTTPARSYHAAFNPADTGFLACVKGTNFSNSDTGSNETASKIVLAKDDFGLNSISILPTGSILRIRPLYAPATFVITGSAAIQVDSVATDNTSSSGTEGVETRKIQVIRTNPAPPAIFDYAIFSGESITK